MPCVTGMTPSSRAATLGPASARSAHRLWMDAGCRSDPSSRVMLDLTRGPGWVGRGPPPGGPTKAANELPSCSTYRSLASQISMGGFLGRLRTVQQPIPFRDRVGSACVRIVRRFEMGSAILANDRLPGPSTARAIAAQQGNTARRCVGASSRRDPCAYLAWTAAPWYSATCRRRPSAAADCVPGTAWSRRTRWPAASPSRRNSSASARGPTTGCR